jgi:hypothetical protein
MSPFLKDLGERVIATFAQTFAGSVVVTELNDKSMWMAAAAAGVASVLSLLKGVVAKRVGNTSSASLTGSV